MTSRTAHGLTLALVILSGCAGKPVRRSYEFPGTRKDYPEETVFVSSPKPRVPGRTAKQQQIKAICYAAVAAGAVSCEVFCEGYFKPRKSP